MIASVDSNEMYIQSLYFHIHLPRKVCTIYKGTRPGESNAPCGIAVDASGLVDVSDTGKLIDC